MIKDKIPFVDLASQHWFLGDEIMTAVGDVITQGGFTLGSEVTKFEEEFAEYCGVNYAVGVGSGTDALHFALRALGIGPGDEVITVPNTFIATVEAIIMCGARPVFVDVDESTYLIDPAHLEHAITKRTKAIIPVHLYGQPADMSEICRIAADHGIKVIEDACQAHGASIDNVKVGSLGDAACFSFYPSKNLGGIGDGGIVVTNDKVISEQVKILRNHGESGKNNHIEMGFCSRLHGIQAAALRVKLKFLDRWNKARRFNAETYNVFFEDVAVIRPYCKELNYHVYHLYVIRAKDRDGLRNYLAERGIDTGVHYPIPIHLQPSMSEYGYKRGDFPITEKLTGEILSLPMFPELKQADVERIAVEVINFTSQHRTAA